ncbi:acetylornithine/succinylornithine family transaminase [Candidatus Micrarchaeota archaeon]|nr:acetylornithine/succinylornithine family transaminase [Candidatus Micrarchaeota archaeon]
MNAKTKAEPGLMNTYKRYPLALRSGSGCEVNDADGRTYLDLIGGIACCPLGHSHPAFVKAVQGHAAGLTNVSNLFQAEDAERLAATLGRLGGMDKAFFSNSGTEANESALKLAIAESGKRRFIACHHAFHGRTLGSLSATADAKYRKEFEPLALPVDFIPFNDTDALRKAILPETAAFIVEPIQGEAGVIVPSADYLNEVREVCDEKGILLILDEVQTGNGRTGTFFEYLAHHGRPDIVTTAKGLANGLPIGATLARGLDFKPGQHASTFGGNAFVTGIAHAVVDAIVNEGMMRNAKTRGNQLMDGIRRLQKSEVADVRGKGLMIGIELKKDAEIVRKGLQEAGILVSVVHGKTLRLLPPLTLSALQVNRFIDAFDKVVS